MTPRILRGTQDDSKTGDGMLRIKCAPQRESARVVAMKPAFSMLHQACRLQESRECDAFVSFIGSRAPIEPGHVLAPGVVERDCLPIRWSENRTSGRSAFGRRPIMHQALVRREKVIVLEREFQFAPARVAMAS